MKLQTTLLGLAMVLILALVTALVGPLFIDWNQYRGLLETEASRLAGLSVRVTGPITVRLLPSPRVSLHDIAIGDGKDAIRARSLAIELALGLLTHGVMRAEELRLDGPEIALTLDSSAHVRVPNIPVGFDPGALSINRLAIENGKIILTDLKTETHVSFEHVRFNGEARSLLGPLSGEGTLVFGDELYPYRVSTSRYGADGGLKIRLNVDAVRQLLNLRVDGRLAFTDRAPRFDGNLTVLRPASILAQHKDQLAEPWRLSSQIKATAHSVLMDNVQFIYGSKEQGINVTGAADLTFGNQPKLNATLSSRKIDFDRLLAGGRRASPIIVFQHLVQLADDRFQSNIPLRLAFSADDAAFGGGQIQNLRAEMSSNAHGWDLHRLEFRAPGFSSARASGTITSGHGKVAFTGPTGIKIGDPKIFAAWLEGRPAATQSELHPLNLRGDLTLGSEEVAIKNLNAEFDRKNVTGQVSFFPARGDRPARLEAALQAPELDVDAALGFGHSLLGAVKFEWPRDLKISAGIARATIGTVAARDINVRLSADETGLKIDRFSVADLGGAAFSAQGGVAFAGPHSPQGNLNADLDAPDLTPVITLLSRFAPQTALMMGRRAAVMSPAKLHVQFLLDGAKPAPIGTVAANGNLGKMHLTLNGRSKIDLDALDVADMHLNGELNVADSRALIGMLGLDHVLSAGSGSGALTIAADGPALGSLHLKGRLAASDFEADAAGTATIVSENPSLVLDHFAARGNVLPGPDRNGQPALPFAYAGRVVLGGQKLSLSHIDAKLGMKSLHGKIEVSLAQPHRVRGEVEADDLDGIDLIAPVIGLPLQPGRGSQSRSWSREPFVWKPFGDYVGAIALTAHRMNLLPDLTARDVHATLHLSDDEFSCDDVSGTVAGGNFAGVVSFRHAEDGMKTHARFSLANADAARLLSFGAPPAVSGSLAVSAEMEGAGLSPRALIASLRGAGRVALSDANLSALNSQVFDIVIGAVDRGTAIDQAHIADAVVKALKGGRLPVKHAEGPVTIDAGQIRVNQIRIAGLNGDLSLDGTLDLTDGLLDSRLVLSGRREAAGARPDIYVSLQGPLAAPARHIDVSALVGWLTLRAVENQTKKVRAMEETSRRSGNHKPPLPADVPASASQPLVSPPLLFPTAPDGPALFPPVLPAPMVPASPSNLPSNSPNTFGLIAPVQDATHQPARRRSNTVSTPILSTPERLLSGAR